MKTPEQQRLLRDVLNEDESYTAFRAELRQTILTELRRRRWSRRAQPLLTLAACVALALTLLWMFRPPGSDNRQPASVAIVRSVPLKPEQIVTTANHRSNIATVQSRNIEIMAVGLEIVRTIGGFRADTLTDQELLDLFKGRAVALVDLDSGRKLVFLDEDAPRGE
jgi:hypothetical protein